MHRKVTNKEFTPKETVAELDRFVVGQQSAKRAVAIAFRNRWRRRHVPDEIKSEIYPHNIMMIGPTGVGKTEIARRLAKLVQAPFLKIEATKFTEVGYVGRDVDSIIRDLLDLAVHMTKERLYEEVKTQAHDATLAKIVTVLVGENSSEETKTKFLAKVEAGVFDEKEIEINIVDSGGASSQLPMFDIPGVPGGQLGVMNIGDMISKALGGAKTKLVKLKVKDAYNIILKEESDKLLDEEKVVRESINLVENDGIVFLDEIDKICSRSDSRGEVSREGVQRDLLPLLEGSTINTRYGPVKTDHILFIASGAFHLAKPSDLLPELQGRLPIRVELNPLTEDDMVRILKEPEHSLLKQYKALFAVEKVDIEFKEDGILEIAKIAAEINKEVENIGARRLHTILEKLLEEINFTASDKPNIKVKIDKKYVHKHLAEIMRKHDLSKFIL
jgi:ATP-dependent HslUV protease ATP-binding subunit HslU